MPGSSLWMSWIKSLTVEIIGLRWNRHFSCLEGRGRASTGRPCLYCTERSTAWRRHQKWSFMYTCMYWRNFIIITKLSCRKSTTRWCYSATAGVWETPLAELKRQKTDMYIDIDPYPKLHIRHKFILCLTKQQQGDRQRDAADWQILLIHTHILPFPHPQHTIDQSIDRQCRLQTAWTIDR